MNNSNRTGAVTLTEALKHMSPDQGVKFAGISRDGYSSGSAQKGVCPVCGGAGYLRLEVSVGHPRFGKMELCECRRYKVVEHLKKKMYMYCDMDSLAGMTFENFRQQGRPGIPQNSANSLEAAYTMAKEYSESLMGWLVLQGSVGCGKTHLAAAVANRAAARDVPTLFLAVPDLLDKIRNSYNGSGVDGFESLFSDIQNIPFLVLDDYGSENLTDWAKEKIFQLINYRYINQMPTVVTTNIDLLMAEDRTSSRLVDVGLSVLVRIEAPDYRRGAIVSGSKLPNTIKFPPGIADRKFENFNVDNFSNLDEGVRKNIGSALQAAKKYAAKTKDEGWILFFGKGNTGKTHLASAIANRRKDKGAQVVFCVVPDLLDQLRSSYSSQSAGSGYHQMLEDIRTAELLVLDDLNTVSATNWAKEKLYQILNYRYNYYLPTVITTSYALSDLDSRIRSRLMDTKLCSAYQLGR